MIEEQTNPPASTQPAKTFSQTEVDRLMMTHRRNLQDKIKEYEARDLDIESATATERGKWQSQVAEIEDRQSKLIADAVASKEAELTTKLSEQSALHTASFTDLQTRHSEAETKLNDVTSRYHQHRITHELMSAASQGDAYVPQQIVQLIDRHAKVIDDRVVVQLGDKMLAPSEVIAEMRADAERYGNLFKSNLVSGIGGQSGSKLGHGRMDLKSLSPEQYRDMRSKAPELLGLRGNQ